MATSLKMILGPQELKDYDKKEGKKNILNEFNYKDILI